MESSPKFNKLFIMTRLAFTLLLFASSVFLVFADHRDYDTHGCCLSCGQFWCEDSQKCLTEWEECKMGEFDAKACTYTYTATVDESLNFHYDLSKYQKEDYYKIQDIDSHPNQFYYYYFRLCKPVDTKLLPKVCSKTTGSGLETCKGNAMAFQYFTADWEDSEFCTRLSDCFEDGPAREIGLIDPVKPAGGIYLKYSGGNTCPNSYSDHASCYTHTKKVGDAVSYCSRSFTLNIHCHNEITEVAAEEDVIEAAGCQYIVNINHAMGCPVECPRDSDGRVCSARGSCFYPGYDAGSTFESVGAPLQCLCEKGYYGDACDQTEMERMIQVTATATHAPAWLLYILLFSILIAIVLLLLLYFEKVGLIASGSLEVIRCKLDDIIPGSWLSSDERGRYAPLSTNNGSNKSARAVAAELSSRQSQSGGKYFGVLRGIGSMDMDDEPVEDVKSTFAKMAEVPRQSSSSSSAGHSGRGKEPEIHSV